MQYIKVNNGIIIEHISSETPIEGAIPVSDFYGIVGDPVSYYNNDWTRKTDMELYAEGLKEVPKGKIIDGNNLRDMTEIEKIKANIIPLPYGMKISNDELVAMSQEELLEAGLITEEEFHKQEAISLRSQLESYLSDTDYAVIKCKELELDIETEYPNLLENRQQARDRINQIDNNYPDLKAKLSYPL